MGNYPLSSHFAITLASQIGQVMRHRVGGNRSATRYTMWYDKELDIFWSFPGEVVGTPRQLRRQMVSLAMNHYYRPWHIMPISSRARDQRQHRGPTERRSSRKDGTEMSDYVSHYLPISTCDGMGLLSHRRRKGTLRRAPPIRRRLTLRSINCDGTAAASCRSFS